MCVCVVEERKSLWNGELTTNLFVTHKYQVFMLCFFFFHSNAINHKYFFCCFSFTKASATFSAQIRVIWPRLLIQTFVWFRRHFTGKKQFQNIPFDSFFLFPMPLPTRLHMHTFLFCVWDSSTLRQVHVTSHFLKIQLFLLPARRRWWDLFKHLQQQQQEWRFKVETKNLTLWMSSAERK